MTEGVAAIILVGGSGERLRPYTASQPKALVPIAGKPILFHQLAWLRRFGVTRVVLAGGYRSDDIAAAVGDGSAWSLDVSLSVEQTKLGRGGALKLAARSIPLDVPFLALNGDLITDFDVRSMLAQHERLRVLATIAVAPLRSPHGIVTIEQDRVTGFAEKPVLPHWISAGVYALSPAVIDRLPDTGDHEDTLFPALAAAGELGAYPIHSYWRSIDSPKDVLDVTREFEAPGGRRAG